LNLVSSSFVRRLLNFPRACWKESLTESMVRNQPMAVRGEQTGFATQHMYCTEPVLYIHEELRFKLASTDCS
jgi:hypothetical protein